MSIFANHKELLEIDGESAQRSIVLDILEAGIESVLPGKAMKELQQAFQQGHYVLDMKARDLRSLFHQVLNFLIAQEQVPLDERHMGPKTRGAGRRNQTGRSRPDHHQMITAGRLRIDPVGRMHVLDERPVVGVAR